MRASLLFAVCFAQVALWYQGWKDRFPENLRSDPRVMAQFSAALTLMDQVRYVFPNRVWCFTIVFCFLFTGKVGSVCAEMVCKCHVEVLGAQHLNPHGPGALLGSGQRLSCVSVFFLPLGLETCALGWSVLI